MRSTRMLVVICAGLGAAVVALANAAVYLGREHGTGGTLLALAGMGALVFYLGRIYQEAEVADGIEMPKRVSKLVPIRRKSIGEGIDES